MPLMLPLCFPLLVLLVSTHGQLRGTPRDVPSLSQVGAPPPQPPPPPPTAWGRIYPEQREMVPLVIVSDGCSGSSFIMATVMQLLKETAGVKICDTGTPVRAALELLVPKGKNMPARYKGRPMAEVLRAIHGECIAQNATFIFKGKPVQSVLVNAGALNELGARVAFTYRANLVDRLICVVMDCFHPMLGQPVVARTGRASGECFSRRKTPWRSDRGLAVKLNVSAFVSRLEHPPGNLGGWGAHQAFLLDAAGLGPRPVVPLTYEELALYTHSRQDLHLSVAAFRRILHSFGYRIPEERIAAVLGRDAATRPKPAAHSRKVYNFDELRHALEDKVKVGSIPPHIRAMLRDA
mmetsp:Transcript_19096/g.49287  ORF Transcript_19096/g.49287 Transcript_19096/m.49287 type:complete len:351 (+) Transcript_19096:104-1156(+)